MTTAHHTAGSTSANHSAHVTAAASIVSGAMSGHRGTARNIYRSPVEDIIARFPSAAAFAQAVGVSGHAVYQWRKAGYIPRKSRHRVAAALGVLPDALPLVSKPLQPLIEAAGGQIALAAALGITSGAISRWRRGYDVPPRHQPKLRAMGLLP